MQLGRLKRRMAGEAAALPLTQRRSAAPQHL
jgi:hypothetical protein